MENTDPNRQPPSKASELLDVAAVSAAAQSDESRYLHVRPPANSLCPWFSTISFL